MRSVFSLVLAVALATPLAAQVESPVPFDSAGRIMTVTPALAQRLALAPPVWPVVGTFREARVFLAGAERFVLVVERLDGARERFPMSATEYEALRGAVSSALGSRPAPAPAAPAPARTDQPAPRMGEAPRQEPVATPPVEPRAGTREDGDVSRAAFTLRMMAAAATIYGPAAWVIVGEPAGGFAAYLGVVSASFFGSFAATRSGTSRAQSELASDFAVRGAGAGWLLADALNSTDDKERATGIFLVGLGSTIAGYHVAKQLTVPEVSSMTFGSTAAGLTTLGLLVATGSVNNSDYSRNDAAPILAAGVAGLPLGLWYHRTAPHFITSGDVRAMAITGALGALTGITVVSRFKDAEEKSAAAAATAGWVAGLVAGDLFLARRYDHTRAEALLLGLGTVAGALAGAAPFVIADKGESSRFLVGSTLGAALGLWGTTVLSNPAPGTANRASGSPIERRVGRVSLHPLNAAFAATRVTGTFPVVTLAF